MKKKTPPKKKGKAKIVKASRPVPKKAARKAVKVAAKKAAPKAAPPKAAPPAARRAAPAAGSYTPPPISGSGWPAFRYPLQ